MTTTQPTPMPIRDAITGEPVQVWPHDDSTWQGRWVLVNIGTGEDAWLTPTAALALADALRQAAAEVIANTEVTRPKNAAAPGRAPAPAPASANT